MADREGGAWPCVPRGRTPRLLSRPGSTSATGPSPGDQATRSLVFSLGLTGQPSSRAREVPVLQQGSQGRLDGASSPCPLSRFPPVLDMQQTYDMWLKKHNPGKPGEGTPISSREGEKQIQMPTDYADIMVMPRRARAAGRGSASGQRGEERAPTVAVPPDGLPLLALRQEQQQQEAVAAAHPVREAQGEGLHVRQRCQRLGLPLPHGRVPALRQVLAGAGAGRAHMPWPRERRPWLAPALLGPEMALKGWCVQKQLLLDVKSLALGRTGLEG